MKLGRRRVSKKKKKALFCCEVGTSHSSRIGVQLKGRELATLSIYYVLRDVFMVSLFDFMKDFVFSVIRGHG